MEIRFVISNIKINTDNIKVIKLIKSNRPSKRRYAERIRPKGQRSSEEERRVDALALRADEGRDKLRKASGRSKYPSIRRYPNGETRLVKQSSLHESIV